MKKLTMILMLAALALVAASLALFLLRTEEENPDFGYVKPLYTLDDRVEITDCEGDTDVVRATHYAFGSLGSSGSITVWFETDRELALTSRRYWNGSEIEFRAAKYEEYMVEKLIDGEWEEICGFNAGGQAGQMTAGSPIYEKFSPEFAKEQIVLGPDAPEPGLYRVTHYFRDDIDREPYAYDTGPTLYTVSYTIEVPPRLGRIGDVLGVMLNAYSLFPDEQGNYLRAVISLGRDEGTLYLDRARMTLEKQVGSEWVAVGDVSEDTPAVRWSVPEDTPADERYQYCGIKYMLNVYPYIDDPEAVYRLTLEFVEHEDGSGERYTLSLGLKFSA